ncbi:MAG: SUF system NifU family Fe-S cluster assembly protein [Clostridia bacterium]|nr:SUF system NifU family Fe-S cluster assembly protein [Clostridia bacterium]
MDDLNSIYTDVIMEQSTATYNKHKLDGATNKEHGHNPSCGDDITLEIIMDGDVIKNIAFTGHGCAISQASTSIMIDLLKGKTKEKALRLINIFLKMVKRQKITDEEIEDLEEANALQNISNMPARVKCAELAWYTMQRLLEK